MKQVFKRWWLLPLIIIAGALLTSGAYAYSNANFVAFITHDSANVTNLTASSTRVVNWANASNNFTTYLNHRNNVSIAGGVGVNYVQSGNGGHSQITNSSNMTPNGYSVGFWVNLTNNSGIANSDLFGDDGGDCVIGTGIAGGKGKIGRFTYVCGNLQDVNSTTSWNNNSNIYHVVVTMDLSSQIANIYVNGTLEATRTSFTQGSLNGNRINFGCQNNATTLCANATMNGEFMYNGVLNSSDVTTLYNNGTFFNPYQNATTTTTNFSITATNNYTSATITDFNASITTTMLNQSLVDQSGNRNTLTANGSVVYNSSDSSYYFPDTSTNDRLIETTSVQLNTTWSFSTYFRTSYNARNTLFGDNNALFGYLFIRGGISTGTIVFEPSSIDGLGCSINVSGATFYDNAYHNFIFASTSTNITAYLDNSYFGSCFFSNGTNYINISNIGAGYTGVANSNMNGSLKNIYIFNKTLNSSEMATVYANGSVSDGLVAWYPFVDSWSNVSNYTTTTGQINTTLNSSFVGLGNISVVANSPGNWFTTTYTNYNFTTNLVASILPWANVTAKDLYDGSAITAFSATDNGTNYTTTTGYVQIPELFKYNATIYAANYFPGTLTNANANATQNATLFQAQVTFNATEIITLSNVTAFTVSNNSLLNSNGTATVAPVLYLKAGSYNLTFNKTGWYNLTFPIVVTALQNSTQNLSGVYAYLLNVSLRTQSYLGNTSVTSFTVNASSGLYSYNFSQSTTNGSALIPWTADTNAFFLSNASGYAIGNLTANVTAVGQTNLTIYTYTTNSILFTFYDELTGLLLNTTNVSIGFSSTVYGTNGTTGNGTFYIDLLTPATYTITYSATGYNQRQYFYVVTNQSSTVVQLFLRPSSVSTTVVITVYDLSVNRIPGVYVYALKHNNTGTNDFLVEQCLTDQSGTCSISADVSTSVYKANTTYKFVVYQNGAIVGSNGYTTLTSNTLTISISTSNNPLSSYYNIPSVTFSPITYTSSTATFNEAFLDTGGSTRLFCLYANQKAGATSSIVASNCSSGVAATLNVYANASLGDETDAYSTVLVPEASASPYLLGRLSVPNPGSQGALSAYLIAFFGIGVGAVVFFGFRFYIPGAVIAVIALDYLMFEVTSGFLTQMMVVGLGLLAVVVLIIAGRRGA